MTIKWGAKILENFSLKEARCHGWEDGIYHDCGRLWLVDELCEKLEVVRRAYGKPIIVTSWLRCNKHNMSVGGVTNSYHLNGHAIDIKPEVIPTYLDILEAHAQYEFSFVKRYATFLHCDIRGERP